MEGDGRDGRRRRLCWREMETRELASCYGKESQALGGGEEEMALSEDVATERSLV